MEQDNIITILKSNLLLNFISLKWNTTWNMETCACKLRNQLLCKFNNVFAVKFWKNLAFLLNGVAFNFLPSTIPLRYTEKENYSNSVIFILHTKFHATNILALHSQLMQPIMHGFKPSLLFSKLNSFYWKTLQFWAK